MEIVKNDHTLNDIRLGWIQENFVKSQAKHNSKNDFFPEYFLSQMSLEARMQLTCHLLGTVMGMASKHNIELSLGSCRAYIEANKWDMWKYAVTENLPRAATTVPEIPPQWDETYEHSELETLLMADVRGFNLASMPSIRNYLFDLHHQRFCIYYVWKLICDRFDARFRTIETRILEHELDKFEIPMIVAYAAKYATFKPYDYQPETSR